MFYLKFGKRIFDFFLALLAIILFSPVLVGLALMARQRLGTPILFRQYRPGLRGKVFTLFKFRTMNDKRDPAGQLMPDAERLEPFGRLLRSSSLDELPELFNVLKGEMSLVGPRPLLIEYLELYSPEQMRRNEVKPGITGWAQVNGRNNLSWEEKFALDIWYIDNLSLWLDLKILLLTARQIIMREGINQPGQATVEHFRGESS
jgi:sugar transferase EpsL